MEKHDHDEKKEFRGERREIADRQRRLVIIIVVAFVLALAGSFPYVIGSQQVNKEIKRIRSAAATLHISSTDFAASTNTGAVPDPVAAALGIDDIDVSARSLQSNEWCLAIEVRRLLATTTIGFRLDANGRLFEDLTCRD
jgi:flagellar basal body-associated protein FliL